MSSAALRARRTGVAQRLRSWAAQHLQCAVAGLGTLWRTPLGTALTSSVIGVALALPLSLFLLVQSIADLSNRLGPGFEISAFLRSELDESRAEALAQRLRDRGDVAGVRIIGRDEALAELRAAAGVSVGADAFAAASPLPVVLVLTPGANDDAAVSELVETLGALPEVDAVLADRAWLARLQAIVSVARRVLWISAALLAAGVMLVIGNTLRLTVEARRAEVEIAKLFGASDAFVRRPFLYQGLLYGAVGALVGCILVVTVAVLLSAPVATLAAEYSTTISVPMPQAIHLVSLLGCGAGLGLLGAWLSVGRHLRSVEPR